MTITETIARALCSNDERNPDDPFFVNSPDGLRQWKGYEFDAMTAITALTQAGFAIVPVDPTEDMISAGIIKRHEQPTPEAWSLATSNIYRAMVAATLEGNRQEPAHSVGVEGGRPPNGNHPACEADCARHWTGVRNKNARLAAALKDNIVAIDDWLNTYAHDMCDEERVKEARDRISTHGGTLAYIARIQQTNRAILKACQPLDSEKGE